VKSTRDDVRLSLIYEAPPFKVERGALD